MDNNNSQNNVKVFGNASVNTDKKVDSSGGGANTTKNEKTIFFVCLEPFTVNSIAEAPRICPV